MSISLSREQYNNALDRLLVNGEPAAIVGPIVPEAAELFVSYYGEQWKWWALIVGVNGGIWLVRNSAKPSDCPLLMEASETPAVLKSSWDTPAPERPTIRTRRGRKAGA